MLLKVVRGTFLSLLKIYRFFRKKDMKIKLINAKMCVNHGVMIADVLCDGSLEARKTFFPSSWSREKVVEKLAEAAKNIIDFAVTIEGVQGIMVGKTSEGVIIKFVVDLKTGEYVNAYPDARANGLFS